MFPALPRRGRHLNGPRRGGGGVGEHVRVVEVEVVVVVEAQRVEGRRVGADQLLGGGHAPRGLGAPQRVVLQLLEGALGEVVEVIVRVLSHGGRSAVVPSGLEACGGVKVGKLFRFLDGTNQSCMERVAQLLPDVSCRDVILQVVVVPVQSTEYVIASVPPKRTQSALSMCLRQQAQPDPPKAATSSGTATTKRNTRGFAFTLPQLPRLRSSRSQRDSRPIPASSPPRRRHPTLPLRLAYPRNPLTFHMQQALPSLEPWVPCQFPPNTSGDSTFFLRP
ncbi:hypothetical protein VUR80DRAFT_827 [Thermomyces stellatus]